MAAAVGCRRHASRLVERPSAGLYSQRDLRVAPVPPSTKEVPLALAVAAVLSIGRVTSSRQAESWPRHASSLETTGSALILRPCRAALYPDHVAVLAVAWGPHKGEVLQPCVDEVVLVAEYDGRCPEQGVEEAQRREQRRRYRHKERRVLERGDAAQREWEGGEAVDDGVDKEGRVVPRRAQLCAAVACRRGHGIAIRGCPRHAVSHASRGAGRGPARAACVLIRAGRGAVARETTRVLARRARARAARHHTGRL